MRIALMLSQPARSFMSFATSSLNSWSSAAFLSLCFYRSSRTSATIFWLLETWRSQTPSQPSRMNSSSELRSISTTSGRDVTACSS